MELDLQRFYNLNRRVLMWIAFFAILWLMREFFAVMFLTFIFGFVMRKVAQFIVDRTRAPYWAAVLGPYLVVLTLLILLIALAVPRVVDESARFSRKFPTLLDTLAVEVEKTSERYGMERVLARYVNDGHSAVAATAQASQPEFAEPPPPEPIELRALVAKIQSTLLTLLPDTTGEEAKDDLPGREDRHDGQRVGELLVGFARGVIGGTMQFLLAFLLSFLIVMDFDHIARELRTWRESPVGRFFHQAASSVIDFSEVVGTAFQCQMVIAVLNASITCVGLSVLDIQPVALLTTIVLIMGLIPVLGVFISSVPIILIAFNDVGLNHALLALGVIVIVHLLEAYVFNPRVYAARFHLNPVMVLIILVVAHELFGVWGMLLGIPVTHYVLNIAQMPSYPRKGRQRGKGSGDTPIQVVGH